MLRIHSGFILKKRVHCQKYVWKHWIRTHWIRRPLTAYDSIYQYEKKKPSYKHMGSIFFRARSSCRKAQSLRLETKVHTVLLTDKWIRSCPSCAWGWTGSRQRTKSWSCRGKSPTLNPAPPPGAPSRNWGGQWVCFCCPHFVIIIMTILTTSTMMTSMYRGLCAKPGRLVSHSWPRLILMTPRGETFVDWGNRGRLNDRSCVITYYIEWLLSLIFSCNSVSIYLSVLWIPVPFDIWDFRFPESQLNIFLLTTNEKHI